MLDLLLPRQRGEPALQEPSQLFKNKGRATLTAARPFSF